MINRREISEFIYNFACVCNISNVSLESSYCVTSDINTREVTALFHLRTNYKTFLNCNISVLPNSLDIV